MDVWVAVNIPLWVSVLAMLIKVKAMFPLTHVTFCGRLGVSKVRGNSHAEVYHKRLRP